MTNANPLPDRLLELLADRSVGALDEHGRRELETLLREARVEDDDSIDLAAAAALVAMTGDPEPLPDDVRTRVLGAIRAESAPGEPELKLVGSPAAEPARTQRTPLLAWTGWIAAAACLVIAVAIGTNSGTPADSPASVAAARQQFLGTAPDLKATAWGDWDNPEQPGVTGRVEWSEARQKGYMTFTGLAPNDPSKEQYQLWIIDERGIEQRISGAIFNAESDTGEVIVEIDPAIEVHNASMFAITIEEPGGTWISDMSRRVVIASLQG